MTDHDAPGPPDDSVPASHSSPEIGPPPAADPLNAPLEDLLAARTPPAPEAHVGTGPEVVPAEHVGMDTELAAAADERPSVEPNGASEPVVQEPVVASEPVVQEPVIASEPVVQVPVVQEPVMQVPVVAHEPVVQEPVIAAEHVAHEPVVQVPAVAHEPVVQEPVVVEPVVQDPVLQQPVPAPRPVKPQHRSFLRELPVLVLIAFLLALLIKHFLVQAFYIPSGSMEQTLMVGDRVLVNKVPYHYREPHRGEIVVFNGLDSFDDGVSFVQPSNPITKALRKVTSAVGFGAPNEKDYIKRVIGVPGDRVMCCDTNGAVVVTPKSGKPASLDEPYIYQNDVTSSRYFCEAVATGKPSSKETCPPGATGILVPPGRLWVMGDHRGNSSDSRFHVSDAHQGTVPENKVVGRAFTVVYPFSRFGFLHVPETFSHVALPALPYVGGLLGAVPLVGIRRRRLRAAG